MVDIQHKNLTGADAIHPSAYKQSSDPGAVGAGKSWYDTSGGEPFTHYVRNNANTGWELIGSSGGGGGGGHTIQDEGSSVTTRTNLNFTGAGVTVTDDFANDQTDVDIPGGSTDPASTTAQGIIEIATQGEVNAGTDAVRAVTPSTLAGRTSSETQSGVIEIATQAETNAGTDDARALTPAKLAGRTASTTQTGVVELATDAETQTGTDTTRAITPSNLSARSATETRTGVAEIATQTETDTGTDDARIVTPLKAATRFLAKAGGTLTGFLTLHADPSSNLHAATKQYVDATASAGTPDATETTKGKAEIATQSETDTGTDDTRIVTPLKLANYSGLGGGSGITVKEDGSSEGTGITTLDFTTGLDVSVASTTATISASGGGGSGNISGAYDIEANTSYTDAGMSDEFASGTLNGKWTTATSSGTIDYPGQPATGVYDLATRSGTLLLQPAFSTSAETSISLRQTDSIASGESLVLSCGVPRTPDFAGQYYTVCAIHLNSSTTSHTTGTYNAIRAMAGLSGVQSGAAVVDMTTNSGSQRSAAYQPAVGGRIYLRISRKTVGGTDSFIWMYSHDGTTWNFLNINSASSFTQVWVAVTQAQQVSGNISNVFPINWIRHVASTAHDLW